MSHNKTIEIMHADTGLSYSECRRLLKAHGWDYTSVRLAMFTNCGVDILCVVAQDMTAILAKAFNSISASLNNMVEALKVLCLRIEEQISEGHEDD